MLDAAREYLADLEAGRRPDRRAHLARHPDLAAALAEYFDGIEMVHAAGPGADGRRPAAGRRPSRWATSASSARSAAAAWAWCTRRCNCRSAGGWR